MKNLTLVFVLLWSSLAFSNAKVVGNGGNETALDFLKSAKQMLSIYSNVLKTYPQLKKHNLGSILDKTTVLVSSTPLNVELRGQIQEVTALNFKNPKTIIINEKRWNAIKSTPVKEALALHELLSLINVEKTGTYFISKNYLVKNGINCKEDLCETEISNETEETFCRFQNNWQLNTETYKYRFICRDKNSEFTIYCDLWKDPIEFNGNKIDALGGTWIPKDEKGGMLNYTYPDEGGKRCTYEDTKDE